MKRLIDIALSLCGLAVLLPVFLLVAVAIKLDSPGPVFFRQERVGLRGRHFRIFKFRTMTVAQRDGLQITVAGDARVTPVGAWLRRYKIDELPQLIDVVRGTMSLVGPRPEVPRYVAAYPAAQRERVLSVRPGITDFASIMFRNENELLAGVADPESTYLNTVLPEKLRVAVNYVDHASLTADIKVLGLTLRTVFVSERAWKALGGLMRYQRFWMGVERMFGWAHEHRGGFALLLDALIVVLAWHLTYLFRLGFERWLPGRPSYDSYVLVGVLLCYLACLALSGVRRSMWRFFAFDDLRRLVVACLAGGLLSAVVVLMAQLVAVPRAVLVLHPVFVLFGLVVARSLYRMLFEHAIAASAGEPDEPRYAVVLGSGALAQRLVAGLHRRDGWFVLAVLDDEPTTHGRRIGGVRVEGGFERMRDPGLTHKATHAIIALEADDARVAGLVALARASGLTVMNVPRAEDLSEVA